MRRRTGSVLVILCLAVLTRGFIICGSLRAQIISADLVGTVLDKTGAVVPRATVEVTNVGTGVKYETIANEGGEYRFNNLPVGTYNVSASASSFAKTTIKGFKLELNKTSTLQIILEIQSASVTVEVSGAAAALDTTTSQVSTTFDEALTRDLPSASVVGGVLNLSLLSGGVESGGGIGAGTGPSVGGQRPRNNNFTIEGVDNNNKVTTGPLVIVPNDAVAEFSLLQNQFTPDFGHSSGGQFNTIIKSGTNSFHGSAYLYSENRNFDAIDQSTINNGFTSNQRFDNNRMGVQLAVQLLRTNCSFSARWNTTPSVKRRFLALRSVRQRRRGIPHWTLFREFRRPTSKSCRNTCPLRARKTPAVHVGLRAKEWKA